MRQQRNHAQKGRQQHQHQHGRGNKPQHATRAGSQTQEGRQRPGGVHQQQRAQRDMESSMSKPDAAEGSENFEAEPEVESSQRSVSKNKLTNSQSLADKFQKKQRFKKEYAKKYGQDEEEGSQGGRGHRERFSKGGFNNFNNSGKRGARSARKNNAPPPPRKKTSVALPPSLTVRELALRSELKARDVIVKLLDLGGIEEAKSEDLSTGVQMKLPIAPHVVRQLRFEVGWRGRRKSRVQSTEISTMAENLTISREMAELLLEEFGIATEHEQEKFTDEFRTDAEEEILAREDKLRRRPPIVTVMGHVDHGKTSLLDAFRNTNVAAGEHGGITQSVGAFTSSLNDQEIVFLDTPGHEAFTSMRKCGSLMTDIIILVVAATDGVRPQTIESIELAQAADVPLIVALSKVDMPGIDADDAMARVSEELAQHDIVTEVNGGSVQVIPVAAPQKLGLGDLADAITLQAEEMPLLADFACRGEAVVLESRMETGLGGVADVVCRWGTLKVGDNVVCGEQTARVRKMLDTVSGKAIKKATPGTPLRLVGFKEPASPGSDVLAVSAKRAKEVVDLRSRRRKEIEAEASQRDRFKEAEEAAARAEEAQAEPSSGRRYNRFNRPKKGRGGKEEDEAGASADQPEAVPLVPVILKADTDGSLEALRYSVDAMSLDFQQRAVDQGFAPDCGFKVIRRGVGPVSSSDVTLADSFDAHIFAFNVRAPASVVKEANIKDVKLVNQSVIYHLLDDLKSLVEEKAPKAKVAKVLGSAKVLKIFSMNPRNRQEGTWIVAGCQVKSGTIGKKSRLRVVRDGEVVAESGLDSLRHFKDDVDVVKEGQECGITLSQFQDFEEGDVIEAFEIVEADA
ncbi:Translation initiation factor IF-2 [Durusdinium trenchii]|uniref:Translation initiation factor IF-2, mitochondrial n=1 Tax=Durusdinium trenchii TaxID=1381693 RepID=A0ABP0I4M5_9DINO